MMISLSLFLFIQICIITIIEFSTCMVLGSHDSADNHWKYIQTMGQTFHYIMVLLVITAILDTMEFYFIFIYISFPLSNILSLRRYCDTREKETKRIKKKKG